MGAGLCRPARGRRRAQRRVHAQEIAAVEEGRGRVESLCEMEVQTPRSLASVVTPGEGSRGESKATISDFAVSRDSVSPMTPRLPQVREWHSGQTPEAKRGGHGRSAWSLGAGSVSQNTSLGHISGEYRAVGSLNASQDDERSGTSPAITVPFQRGSLIGEGAHARVFHGLNVLTGELIAIKEVIIDSSEDDTRVNTQVLSLEREIAILRHLRHPNIVRCYGSLRDENTINIFLEYVPGGSISQLLCKFGTFQETVIKRYTMQILRGLSFLHKHQILHRDIKGANLLVDNRGTIKLADFGASRMIRELAVERDHAKGTPHFMAPEAIVNREFTNKSDVWSVGCTIIEMATGQPPWSDYDSLEGVMYAIAESQEPPPFPDNCSPAMAQFLGLCLQRVPAMRPATEALMTHAFVANYNRRMLDTSLTLPITTASTTGAPTLHADTQSSVPPSSEEGTPHRARLAIPSNIVFVQNPSVPPMPRHSNRTRHQRTPSSQRDAAAVAAAATGAVALHPVARAHAQAHPLPSTASAESGYPTSVCAASADSSDISGMPSQTTTGSRCSSSASYADPQIMLRNVEQKNRRKRSRRRTSGEHLLPTFRTVGSSNRLPPRPAAADHGHSSSSCFTGSVSSEDEEAIRRTSQTIAQELASLRSLGELPSSANDSVFKEITPASPSLAVPTAPRHHRRSISQGSSVGPHRSDTTDEIVVPPIVRALLSNQRSTGTTQSGETGARPQGATDPVREGRRSNPLPSPDRFH